jgi:hypothetical protein
MAHGNTRPSVPAAPFMTWLERQVAIRDGEVRALAEWLGVHDRVLYRWRAGKKSSSRNGRRGDFPSDTFPRPSVENALHRADVQFWEVYSPEIYPELFVEVENDPPERTIDQKLADVRSAA